LEAIKTENKGSLPGFHHRMGLVEIGKLAVE